MFESILFQLLVRPGSGSLSLSRTRGLKSPNSYEIAYDKYRESLSCPHPPMHDNIVYRRSHRLAIWRYEKWPYRPTLMHTQGGDTSGVHYFSNNSTDRSQLFRLYYGCHTSRHWSDDIFQGICLVFLLKSLLWVGLFLLHLIQSLHC